MVGIGSRSSLRGGLARGEEGWRGYHEVIGHVRGGRISGAHLYPIKTLPSLREAGVSSTCHKEQTEP